MTRATGVGSMPGEDAAAYAEAGQFTEAVRWQTKAMALAAEPAQQSVRALLELYQKGKPFRQLPG